MEGSARQLGMTLSRAIHFIFSLYIRKLSLYLRIYWGWLFNDAMSIENIQLRMRGCLMNDEGKDLEIIGSGLMGVLPRDLSGGNEENHEKCYSEYAVSQLRFPENKC
jgi:hypothetical protein